MAAASGNASANTPLLARVQELREGKIAIHVKAIGAAPLMSPDKFLLNGTRNFDHLVQLLKKNLKKETLYVYCCEAFEPDPEENLGDLYRCFGATGTLRVSYSIVPAMK
mmetsp:Transcript_62873/g.149910  ORF Transcript_62873/g.149910 Transcript_62873/m.149910 type:complete len:109 (+) Transcript_62873:66-392(+)